ncbi:calcium:proton antiporter [Methanomicrobiaceae archaeon CYW5]|uniref:cache domain-containing protein n=1 Tax=Methanovulcanius yangii TaxID=1789227 RepID=UPI0029C9D4B4|nr:cache domain-containing protein [Methanovulcanius yangii]MBT8508853.1 calcium:proton antiporter [Methanovulcanius yangii]
MRSQSITLVILLAVVIAGCGCTDTGAPPREEDAATTEAATATPSSSSSPEGPTSIIRNSDDSSPGFADAAITPDDLASFVWNASDYAGRVGQEASLAEFSRQEGTFSHGNLYIYAYDYNCTLLAHPYQAEVVGTDRSGWTDARGLPLIRISAATASAGGGFNAYLYPSPEGGIIDEKALDTYEPKIGYVAPVGDDWWIGSGIYFSDMMPEGAVRPEVISDMIGLVEDAAAYGREEGSGIAFAEISNRSGMFVDGVGHYIYAYDYNGTLLAHPYLPETIGSNLMENRDSFGMENIRALCDTARSGGGYVVFIWPNPDSENREEFKIGYVLPVDEDWWVGSGVYLSEITGEETVLPS